MGSVVTDAEAPVFEAEAVAYIIKSHILAVSLKRNEYKHFLILDMKVSICKCSSKVVIVFTFTHVDGSRVSIAFICLCNSVYDSLRTIISKWLKLKLPNLAPKLI